VKLLSIKSVVVAFLCARRRAFERRFAEDVRVVLDGTAVQLVDVGASGGILPRWYPHRAGISFTGLEPDERSFKDLLNSPLGKEFSGYRVIPFGAWSGEGAVPIAFTRKPMCSSVFQPNTAFIERFPEPERFDVVGEVEVTCRTLDCLLEGIGDTVDFIKLDLEGGELAVLKGATGTLARVLGLHVEVCFQSLRLGQPLFGEVTTFLAGQKIEFVDFVAITRWERGSHKGAGQAIFADALYLRSPESVVAMLVNGQLGNRKAMAYLAVLLVYERYDLMAIFLGLVEVSPLSIATTYLDVVRELVARRKRTFDRRLRMMQRLSFVQAELAAPHSMLHYIY
jgi:FkbM family methyltransferase